GGHRRVDAGDFLDHQDVGDGVHAGATPLFGDEHAAAAEFGEFFDLSGGVAAFAVTLLHRGTNFVLHELANGVANQFLVVVERKIHRVVGRSTNDAITGAG